MWNKKDLEAKLKYLNELSRNTKDENKRLPIISDKATIIEMLELYKGNKLSIKDGRLFLYKMSVEKEAKKYNEYEDITFDSLKKDLETCFYLCKNLALQYIFVEESPLITEYEEACINDVIAFANSLNDKELSEEIITVAYNKSHIEFPSEIKENGYNGITFNLEIFNESYIATNIEYPDILLHEIIHVIDFNKNGSTSTAYPYSYEAPCHAMEIFRNLKANNLAVTNYLVKMAKKTLYISCYDQAQKSKMFKLDQLEFKDIINKGSYTIKSLLTIRSFLVGFIFAKKIYDNEEVGLKEYKEMLNTRFSKDKVPDYSRWGITNDVIIDYSKNLTKYFSEFQKEKGGKRI